MTDGEHLRFSKKRVTDRTIDELVGLSHGLIADGNVNQSEAEYLQKWLANRPTLAESAFLSGLYDRVEQYLMDDFLDEEEAQDLKEILTGIVGGNFELGEAAKATSLPLCNPYPKIEFIDRRFCFTGTFGYGKRKECETAVKSLGAKAGSLTMKTDFLVIGEYATDSWKHSSFGNKILKAVEFRDRGLPVSIISEMYWRESLGSTL